MGNISREISRDVARVTVLYHAGMRAYREKRPLAAVSWLQEARRDLARLAPGHSNMATLSRGLGLACWLAGSPGDAEFAFRDALSVCETHGLVRDLRYADLLTELASLLSSQGRQAEAEPLLEQALRVVGRCSRQGDARRVEALANLGVVRLQQGRLEEAASLLERALGFAQGAFGARSPRLAPHLLRLGSLKRRQGVLDEAEHLVRLGLEVLKGREQEEPELLRRGLAARDALQHARSGRARP